MEKTAKSMRLQIGIFGRTNVGKSSFLNMIAGQDVAVTSPIPGTTTDVVEKVMELLPIGPVVFLDTAGIDDESQLSDARLRKTAAVYDRAEIIAIITEAGVWGPYEETIISESNRRETPVIAVINKTDITVPGEDFLADVKSHVRGLVTCSSVSVENRDLYVNCFKQTLSAILTQEQLQQPSLIGDLVPPGGTAILIVPIDLQAPKGRLILPQVQTIRDLLDNDSSAIVVKEREYTQMLSLLKEPPSVVVCDSQIVLKMIADTPPEIPCTTFSILFARLKGDLAKLAAGAAAIDSLKDGDKVLIAEACSHHAAEDDIGRVKIPRWLRQYTGLDLTIDICSGRDFPGRLSDYKLAIHCGACMLTRKEMNIRISKAQIADVAITNYGLAISCLQGVIERVLTPFPAALEAYLEAVERND
jgi:[FeFe] hydrogenase H-cluster maturation GTPase HydF